MNDTIHSAFRRADWSLNPVSMLHHHVDFTHDGSASDLTTTKATPCHVKDT